MLRRVWWLIGSLALAAWLAAILALGGTSLKAAPLAVNPTNTGTSVPRTPTSTRPQLTSTPTSGQQTTPTSQQPPGTPTATRKPSNGGGGNNPTPTPQGDPRVTKSVDPSSGRPGDRITFTLVVHNESTVPATDVTLTDSIPGIFEINDVSASQGSVDVSGQQVRVAIGTVPPGGEATVRIATTIRSGTAPGQVDNLVIMNTSTPGDNPGNNTSTVTVTIEGEATSTPTSTPLPPGVPTPLPPGAPTPGAPVPGRLPTTGDTGTGLLLPALMAAVALLSGLALRARRRAR